VDTVNILSRIARKEYDQRVKTRDHYHHGDLRATLVAAGLKQLEEDGQAAISLRALAKAAGVSPNAPYRHFADKNALMGALAAEGFHRFADLVENAGQSPGSPVEKLRAQGSAYLVFATVQPALYHLMFSPYGYSLHSPTCQAESERAFASLIEVTAGAQRFGWKSEVSLNVLVLAYWSYLHGWAGLLCDKLVPPGVPVPSILEVLDVFFSEGKA